MINQRDLELLSAYLDGELNPSDSARLEARLKNDPALDSVLDDLRAARTFLRKLPKRRAPRNFTLTRKMVGLNPPLPRSYPAFRFVTAVATLLFFFTFGINTLAPQFLQPIGFGMGG
ncbi:MAG TPA: zf-HC2 domain-containing protein, partial [Anaerolineales bacterium]|nr:zf-HC2 domain-containing protein [Anaerolineales bacterium]